MLAIKPSSLKPSSLKPSSLKHLVASAWETGRRIRRRPGDALQTGPVVSSAGFHQDAATLLTTGVTVGASPASDGPQEVRVRYAAEFFYGGRWVGFELGSAMSAEVAGGATVTFGPWEAEKPSEVAGTLGFRVVNRITWHDLASQRVVAAAAVTAPELGRHRTRV